MLYNINPAYLFFIGALLLPLLPHLPRSILLLAVPVVSFVQLTGLEYGAHGLINVMGLELTTLRLDKLSFIFAAIFHIAAFLGMIYALHVRDTVQQTAALLYMGAAIGAVLAGDLMTLFVYWEISAISSVFLIWARRTERSRSVGIRYLIIQVLSGILLLAGAAALQSETGSIAFNHIGLESTAGLLIFFAFGIKCAFPLLHNWLQDAYPEATVTGTVILSAFTTKLAVYALARGYAGEPDLIWIGAIMTAFPIFFAVIENDLRRVLAYSLNNQLGFMVVGIGIGTELALNGTAAHAFAHILYKALLFMSMGAVLFRAGTIKASELGGLYKSMPLTAVFCIIGSASISAFPLLSGFVTKSMIMSAAMEEGYVLTFLVLLFASAGVLDHSGIKIPFFSFFAHDSGIRCKEAPRNMLIAMGITAFLCIAIGVYPSALYKWLPYPVDYVPYTLTHVVTQLQLLVFAMVAFAFLYRKGWYPPEIPSLNVDTDWLYRKFAPGTITILERLTTGFMNSAGSGLKYLTTNSATALHAIANPASGLIKTSLIGNIVLTVVVMVFGFLLLLFS
ncbi:MAG: Na(+)/H(+) antiporter subunit D [Arenicellales bacterium WSBS_2016_MAG_OTU3]